MDTFMLLCNLHADGPATRQRLRQAGCDSIEGLSRLSAQELARLLETTPTAAERLQRQAQGLAERIGPNPLEPEPEGLSDVAGVTPRASAIPAPRLARAQVAPEPQALESPRPAIPALPRAEPQGAATRTEPLRPGLFSGLDGTWCRRLAEQDVFTLEALAAAGVRKLARAMQVPFAHLLELQLLAFRQIADRGKPGGPLQPAEVPSAPRAEPPHDRLEPGLLPGLGPDVCRKLVEHGIRRPAELAQASTLSLARAVGLPYIRVLELQVQARQHVTDVLVPKAPPGDRRPLELAPLPRRAVPAHGLPSEPDPGGPFA